MRVLFAGASGTLGRVLVPRLLGAGHEVVALTRSPASAARLIDAGADAVVADALDRDGLLAAAETVGATRFVTQSIVLGYGFGSTPGVVGEDAPFGRPDGTGVDPVLEALAENERLTLRTPGVDGIALRYGLFYGRDGATLQRFLRRRMLPVASGWTGAVPLIHHDDAADATVVALERGAPGSAYNVADDDPTQSWASYVDTAAAAFGAPRPLRVPAGLLRVAIPYAARLMTRLDLRVATDRIRSLEWRPRYASTREGWAADVGG